MSDSPHNPDSPPEPPEKRNAAARGGTRQNVRGGGRASVREIVAAHLAAGMAVKDAAAAAGVADRSIRKWKAEDAEFVALIERLRSEAIAAAMGRLSDRMTAAADVLAGLLGSDDERVRHASAVKILELGTKLRESVAMEERVAELERRFAEKPGGG